MPYAQYNDLNKKVYIKMFTRLDQDISQTNTTHLKSFKHRERFFTQVFLFLFYPNFITSQLTDTVYCFVLFSQTLFLHIHLVNINKIYNGSWLNSFK